MHLKRGDTIIEILFALSVFSLVAIVSINLMNNGVATAQSSLENNMVRNEIDAQAEAIRFVHGAATTGSNPFYAQLWSQINTIALDNVRQQIKIKDFDYPPTDNSCANYYGAEKYNLSTFNAFILNVRRLRATSEGEADDALLEFDQTHFKEAGNYARVLYERQTRSEDDPDETTLATDIQALKIQAAEGIWIIAMASENVFTNTQVPLYYDFYIQSCWYHPGANTPSTIDTTIRLYNPAPTEGT